MVYISWTCAEKFKSFWLLMVYVILPRCFSLHCVSFGSRSKHHNWCNIHLKCKSITDQMASKSVIMRKLPVSSRTVVLVLRMKVFAKTILEHYSQTMFTKTVRILRSGFNIKVLFIKYYNLFYDLSAPFFAWRKKKDWSFLSKETYSQTLQWAWLLWKNQQLPPTPSEMKNTVLT